MVEGGKNMKMNGMRYKKKSCTYKNHVTKVFKLKKEKKGFKLNETKFVTKILKAPKTAKAVDDKNKRKIFVYMSHTYKSEENIRKMESFCFEIFRNCLRTLFFILRFSIYIGTAL